MRWSQNPVTNKGTNTESNTHGRGLSRCLASYRKDGPDTCFNICARCLETDGQRLPPGIRTPSVPRGRTEGTGCDPVLPAPYQASGVSCAILADHLPFLRQGRPPLEKSMDKETGSPLSGLLLVERDNRVDTAKKGGLLMRHSILFALVLVISALSVSEADADSCPASNILGSGIISNICWSCIFPLKVAGITIFGSSISDGGTDGNGFSLSSKPKVPSDAADDVVCICTDGALPTVGVPVGMWVPTELYETTLIPGCSSVLGGLEIGVSDPLYLGTSGDPTSDLEQQSFNHIHSYSYPLVMMMELFTKCSNSYSDIDLLYMSELDPLWNDPVVAMYGNPMSVFGSSIIAQAACAADAITSSFGEPIDDLFWCGGTWSSTMAPYTGYEHAQGPVQFSQSSAQKLLAMNAARGISYRYVGNDALCSPKYSPMLKRSHYRWQVAWPRAEGARNHGSGESPLRWAQGRVIPGVADLPIYLRWSWTDCCATALGE